MTTSRHPLKKAGPDTTTARALDEALDETFPASDPIAVTPDASEAQLKAQQRADQPPVVSRRDAHTAPSRK